MFFATQSLIALTERGWMPDPLTRAGIRHLLRQRLVSLPLTDLKSRQPYLTAFMHGLENAPIALLPEKANEQHYEVPVGFFRSVLGPHLKYSACYWPEPVTRLEDAEAAALLETAQHAELADGQSILELGCGWGSFSLWMAARYPASRIVAVSNSRTQRDFILGQAQRRGHTNLEVVTCDMNAFDTGDRFDRIVSIEMFEHMRNWPRLFRQVAGWLKPEGQFFLHVFCHRTTPYLFEVQDESDWMGQYFFSGGMMPSFDLPTQIESPVELAQQWWWPGSHYEKTANAWLSNMDRHRGTLWPVLVETYGADAARMWWARWRIFFMACAELFGYRQGTEWGVGHYRFRRAAHRAGKHTP
jgi:cyclopropane-fatty-acyl-phospholipid synthase